MPGTTQSRPANSSASPRITAPSSSGIKRDRTAVSGCTDVIVPSAPVATRTTVPPPGEVDSIVAAFPMSAGKKRVSSAHHV